MIQSKRKAMEPRLTPKRCAEWRLEILETALNAGGGHIAPAFSVLEILAVLYHEVLRVRPAEPAWPGRDRLVLSKAHGCLALYVLLADLGFFPREELQRFARPGSFLGGHSDRRVPGVEANTGSLGHGLALSVGMAMAARIDRTDARTFAVLSDGECEEGSTWEAAMSAGHFGLENLTAVIDHNDMQSLGRVSSILSTLAPLAEKWASAGWHVVEVDGHSLPDLRRALSRLPASPGKPTAVVAHTIKGKGVSFMEQVPIWHYRVPQGEEIEIARRELRGDA